VITPIWKSIIDHKYDTTEPNVFCCPEKGASPFWKGVLWASKAAKLGVSWKVGNGKTIRFWEDHWFGNCSLAIQFWDLYVLAEQTNKCIADLWDGRQLLISFRRRLMRMWLDLVAIAESISPTLMTVMPSFGLFMEAPISRSRLYIRLLALGASPQCLLLAFGLLLSLHGSISSFGC